MFASLHSQIPIIHIRRRVCQAANESSPSVWVLIRHPSSFPNRPTDAGKDYHAQFPVSGTCFSSRHHLFFLLLLSFNFHPFLHHIYLHSSKRSACLSYSYSYICYILYFIFFRYPRYPGSLNSVNNHVDGQSSYKHPAKGAGCQSKTPALRHILRCVHLPSDCSNLMHTLTCFDLPLRVS